MRNNVERNHLAENAPPGWYQAETDPPGTERYWDGSTWSEETRAALGPPPSAVPSAPAAAGVRYAPNGRELASVGRRIGARLIDALIVGLISFVLVDIDVSGGQTGYVETSDAILALVLGAAYEILFTAFRSATPGKMALSIEIIRKSDGGSPLGFAPAGMRWLPNLVNVFSAALSGLIAIASLVLLFADKYRRTVFDFVGQTYVVRKQS